ncbi:prenyltransferase [[Clostridium] dakarense]|uniref:prenyltransferase n=1 Tax=Faecalimicrobium dakarense TaxID=1301100 RepID=UPI0005A9BCE1|nr:prenyltransferase [[Clostridium] dakarense]
MNKKNFFERAYTVMEIRTGFATGLPVLSGGLFGAYTVGKLNILLLILMFITGFCLNIVANVANEIRAFLKNEENEDTFTGHLGSEGLVRGDAKLIDALIVMGALLIISGICGLSIVFITKNINILIIGLISVLAAIGYSLGPKPYIAYPVGEFVSGVFVGAISCFVSAYIQTNRANYAILLYSLIAMIMTVFLMSTNNTSDYEKDKGTRITLPHIIGFRNSIKIIIPEAVTMIVFWGILYFTNNISIIMFISGLVVFYYYGYLRWYRDYYKIEEVYPQMGKDWGPRPLLLIYGFHIVMSIEFLASLIIK